LKLLRIDAAMLGQASTAGLRDPNDLPTLALLAGSGPNHLVTGAKDLLALAGTYPLLTPSDFVDHGRTSLINSCHELTRHLSRAHRTLL